MLVSTRLLISIKHYENGEVAWEVKARFIGFGHLYWTKWLRPRRYIRDTDYWCPVSSLTGARLVHARATAHRRAEETIDMFSAYIQVLLGGSVAIYLIFEEDVINSLPEELRALYRALEEPVSKLEKALYGIGRAG